MTGYEVNRCLVTYYTPNAQNGLTLRKFGSGVTAIETMMSIMFIKLRTVWNNFPIFLILREIFPSKIGFSEMLIISNICWLLNIKHFIRRRSATRYPNSKLKLRFFSYRFKLWVNIPHWLPSINATSMKRNCHTFPLLQTRNYV